MPASIASTKIGPTAYSPLFRGLKNGLNRFFIAGQIRGKAALIADKVASPLAFSKEVHGRLPYTSAGLPEDFLHQPA